MLRVAARETAMESMFCPRFLQVFIMDTKTPSLQLMFWSGTAISAACCSLHHGRSCAALSVTAVCRHGRLRTSGPPGLGVAADRRDFGSFSTLTRLAQDLGRLRTLVFSTVVPSSSALFTFIGFTVFLLKSSFSRHMTQRCDSTSFTVFLLKALSRVV